ncbi:MAG: hypothetical protein P4L43_09420 [Syntrophobacteraceae bacterium]|nr:hypothetical protein [Syntrophobacteraceae bacterium]
MTRMTLTILFSCAAAAGLWLIARGLGAGSGRRAGLARSKKLPLGFADSPEQPFEFLDPDMGHEGLMHRQKERLDPARYRPEPISSGKKIADRVQVAGQENKASKIDI